LFQRNESRLSDSEDHNYSMGGVSKYEGIETISDGVMGPQTGYIGKKILFTLIAFSLILLVFIVRP